MLALLSFLDYHQSITSFYVLYVKVQLSYDLCTYVTTEFVPIFIPFSLQLFNHQEKWCRTRAGSKTTEVGDQMKR